MDRAPLFVGYGQIEEWCKTINTAEPVYASRMVELIGRREAGALVEYDLAVMVAQPDATGIVHYWRFSATRLSLLYSRPFDDDADLRQQHHADVWEFLRDWLDEQGLAIRRATIAMPLNYRYLDGQASFFWWDAEAKRYRKAADRPLHLDLSVPESRR